VRRVSANRMKENIPEAIQSLIGKI